MRELKFKEESNLYSIELESGIRIKPYLTIDELNTIILDMKENQMKTEKDGTKTDTGKQKSALARHFSKVILTTDFCTNILIDGMDADEVYDLVAELCLMDEFKTFIPMYNEIDDMIESDESTYNLMKEITDSLLPQLNTAMEKLGDGSGLMDKLKGVIGNVNKKSD